jgi:hypothetical protein
MSCCAVMPLRREALRLYDAHFAQMWNFNTRERAINCTG